MAPAPADCAMSAPRLATALLVTSLIATANAARPVPADSAVAEVEKLFWFCAATVTLATLLIIAPGSISARVFTVPVE